MRFDGYHVEGSGQNLHVRGRQTVNTVGGDRANRLLDSSDLVGNVLIEYARALVEVLRGTDKTLDISAGIYSRVRVSFECGIKNEFLIREFRCYTF